MIIFFFICIFIAIFKLNECVDRGNSALNAHCSHLSLKIKVHFSKLPAVISVMAVLRAAKSILMRFSSCAISLLGILIKYNVTESNQIYSIFFHDLFSNLSPI